MHPLALLCFGMYGETLPNQDGAPVRMVLPWKYGFKSIKSLVKIKLVEKKPDTTWNLANSNEYGFYSNVNPNVDHPRCSQAKERRLGEFFRRPTLMFNGYDQVASLYAGMDLKKEFLETVSVCEKFSAANGSSCRCSYCAWSRWASWPGGRCTTT